MSTPAATQPAALSQQIAALQAFAKAGVVLHEPGAEVTSPADVEIDADQLGAAWSQLKEVVFGNDVPDAMRSSWNQDELGFFAENTFTLAQKTIGSRLVSLTEEDVNRAVLNREGVDPFKLEQHTEEGLLSREPVRAFNASAAQYLQTRLNDAGIKLGDFILNAARAYFSGQFRHLVDIEPQVGRFYRAMKVGYELRTHVDDDRIGKVEITYLGPDHGKEDSEWMVGADVGEVLPDYIFEHCNSALAILAAGSTGLNHRDFFRYPLLTSSDIGLMMALGSNETMRSEVIWAFFTKLNIMKKRPDGLAIL